MKNFFFFIFNIFFIFYTFYSYANNDFDRETIEIYNRAVNYYNNQDYQNAVNLFEQLYLKNINSDEIKNNYIASVNAYSIYLIEKKQYLDAVEKLESVYKLAKDNNIIRENLGAIYLKIGNNHFEKREYDEALEYYFKSEQYLKDKIARENIASAYFNKAVLNKNEEEAFELYNESLKYNPGNFEAYYNIGIIYFNKKKNSEAVTSFDKIINSDSKLKYSALLHKAIIFENSGNYREAADYFRKIISNSKNKNDVASAKKYLIGITPQKYKLSYIVNIKNPSAYNLKNLTAIINLPNDFSGRQKIEKTEIRTLVKFTQQNIFDEYNNKFIKMNFDSIGANQNLKIRIDNYITVMPAVWNLEKLKSMRINKKNIQANLTFLPNDDSVFNALKKIYDYVLDFLEYEIIERDLSIEEILNSGRGKCVEYAVLLDYLCGQLNLKSKIVYGEAYTQFENEAVSLRAGHSWTEIWFDGLGWVAFDPTFEDTGKRNYFANLRSGHIINSYSKVNFIDLQYKISYIGNNEPSVNLMVDIDKEFILIKQ